MTEEELEQEAAELVAGMIYALGRGRAESAPDIYKRAIIRLVKKYADS